MKKNDVLIRKFGIKLQLSGNRSLLHIYLLNFDCVSDWLDGRAYPGIFGTQD